MLLAILSGLLGFALGAGGLAVAALLADGRRPEAQIQRGRGYVSAVGFQTPKARDEGQ